MIPYNVLLHGHILGVHGIFIATGMEHLVLWRLRVARTRASTCVLLGPPADPAVFDLFADFPDPDRGKNTRRRSFKNRTSGGDQSRLQTGFLSPPPCNACRIRSSEEKGDGDHEFSRKVLAAGASNTELSFDYQASALGWSGWAAPLCGRALD